MVIYDYRYSKDYPMHEYEFSSVMERYALCRIKFGVWQSNANQILIGIILMQYTQYAGVPQKNFYSRY